MDCAILEGKIKTYARDPKTGAQYHVDRRDWKAAAFREESLRGGTIRACAGERIEQYRDWDAVIDEDSFERWLAAEKSRRPIADERKFGALLLEAMRASSDQKNRTKREWRILEIRHRGQRINVGSARSTSKSSPVNRCSKSSWTDFRSVAKVLRFLFFDWLKPQARSRSAARKVTNEPQKGWKGRPSRRDSVALAGSSTRIGCDCRTA